MHTNNGVGKAVRQVQEIQITTSRVKYKKHETAALFFGIESFCWQKTEPIKVSILSFEGKPTAYGTSENSISSYWPYFQTFPAFEEDLVDFHNEKHFSNYINMKI
jgi:hypothetical protein